MITAKAATKFVPNPWRPSPLTQWRSCCDTQWTGDDPCLACGGPGEPAKSPTLTASMHSAWHREGET